MNGYREETSAWLRSSALGLGLVRVRSFADCSLIGAPNQGGLTGWRLLGSISHDQSAAASAPHSLWAAAAPKVATPASAESGWLLLLPSVTLAGSLSSRF
jgi:hypothetical protein